MNAPPLLAMQGIGKRFGPTRALSDVSIEARGGEVLALIGENGAGKSTLMKILSGALRPDQGQMLLAGEPYRPASPHAGHASGVAMIYQELALAPELNVEDNIMLGQERHRFGWLDRRAQRKLVRETLERLRHPELSPRVPVAALSVGAQQLVEIARALVRESRVLVFDEPTSSLTQRDAAHLFEIIGELKQAGLAIIYISHFLEEIRAVADRYTVLRDGEMAGNGTLAEVTESELVTMMVGRSVEELFPTVPHQAGPELVQVRGLSGWSMPHDVDLVLHRGEIVGVAGLVGAGRTELLRCLMALDPVRRGEVRIAGVRCRAAPRARIQAGLGLVSENRKTEGLAQELDIADNLTLSHLRPYSRGGWLNLRRRREAVRAWMAQLHVRARGPHQTIGELSGGNQQKVAIARLLHQDADLLLLDEPTRGIDVAAKAEIYRLVGTLAAQGKAVIFVSSYLPELMAVCDRLAVMSRGRLRGERPVSQWTEELVMAEAVGGAETSGRAARGAS